MIVTFHTWFDIRGSSNGRTPGFGPGNRGSNPCPRTKEKSRRAAVVFLCVMGWREHAIEACLTGENGRSHVALILARSATARPGPEPEFSEENER